jgi:hypothetical protein
MSSMKNSAAERMELETVLVPKMKAAGLRILIGGDYGFPFNPNGRNARDLSHFVQYFGFSGGGAERRHRAGRRIDGPEGGSGEGRLSG